MNTKKLIGGMFLAAVFGAAYAQGSAVVKSDEILDALSVAPKAVQRADGSWIQRDPSIDLQVQFEFNKSTLTKLGEQQLDELAAAFKTPALASEKFELAGHTDKVGSAEYNRNLSQKRAESAKSYLQHKHGIVVDRMIAKGYGFDKLSDPAKPTDGINRRVEIRRLSTATAGAPQSLPSQNTGGGVLINRQ